MELLFGIVIVMLIIVIAKFVVVIVVPLLVSLFFIAIGVAFCLGIVAVAVSMMAS